MDVIGGILIIVAALSLIHRAAPGAWQTVRGFARLVNTLEDIKKEFAPNGGGTIRDSLNRIEAATMSKVELEAFLALEGRVVAIERGEADVIMRVHKRLDEFV